MNTDDKLKYFITTTITIKKITLYTKVSDFNYTALQKKGVEIPKNSVFDQFRKIVELTTDVLEPSLLSEIDN